MGGDRNPYGLSLPYALASNPYNGLPVGSINTGEIPNKNLVPYKVTSYEFGAEIKLLKNRLMVDLLFIIRKPPMILLAARYHKPLVLVVC